MKRWLRVLSLLVVLAGAGCARMKPPAPTPAPTPAPSPSPAPPTPSPVPPATSERPRLEWIDVGVLVDVDSARIGVTGEAEVLGVVEIASLEGARSIVARAVGGRLLVQPVPALRELAVYEVADTLMVRPLDPATLVQVNGKLYRGALKVFRSPAGRVTVVNRVGREDYLRGVLPHEIGRLDERTIEAGKAQAVAARTYALAYVGRRSDQGFDVYGSVEDQLYGGSGSEGPLTDRCVTETAGLVGTYQGRLIRANYFSTCGGVTANVEDVWPESPLAWLRSRSDVDGKDGKAYCAASPQFRWTEIWSVDEFVAIVNRAYPQVIHPLPRPIRRLDGVRVGSRSASGRVAELILETDVGTLTAHGDSTRRVLLRPAGSTGAGGGGGLLRSSLFKIALVRDRAGLPLAVVATGAGFGHGVGMCQWGALEMARRGHGFRDILEHYFAGVRIRPASEILG